MFYNLIRSTTKRKGHTLKIVEGTERIEKEVKMKLDNKEIISYRSSVKLKKKYGI